MKDNDESLRINYNRMISATAFIVFPLMTLMAVLAKPLIVCLITEKWIECVPYLQLMCFWLILSPIHGLNFQLLMVKGRTDLTLKTEIYKKVICFTLMVITLPYGITHFICGSIVSSILCFFINAFYTGKLIKVGILAQLKDIVPSMIMSCLMGIVVLAVNNQLSNLYCQIVCGALLGFVVFIGMSILFKRPELEDVKYLLNRK